MQIPDAVYHLMRNTELVTCNLSGNVLKSVSPKFSQKFSRNNGNRSSNLSSDDTEESGISDDPSIPPHIARIGGIGTFPPIAGQGVIRVVQRCEDAKENHKLGKQMVTQNNQPTHSFFLFEAQLQLDGCEFGFSLFHL